MGRRGPVLEPIERESREDDLIVSLGLVKAAQASVGQLGQATVGETSRLEYPRNGPGFAVVEAGVDGAVLASLLTAWATEDQRLFAVSPGRFDSQDTAHTEGSPA